MVEDGTQKGADTQNGVLKGDNAASFTKENLNRLPNVEATERVATRVNRMDEEIAKGEQKRNGSGQYSD